MYYLYSSGSSVVVFNICNFPFFALNDVNIVGDLTLTNCAIRNQAWATFVTVGYCYLASSINSLCKGERWHLRGSNIGMLGSAMTNVMTHLLFLDQRMKICCECFYCGRAF